MVVAISMCKDEADVISETVGWMLEQVDQVLVADNGSTDGTREILIGLGIELRDDPDPAYYQSKKMSALAAEAFEFGAEWVVPFDADEIWAASKGTVAEMLGRLPAEALVCQAKVYDHVAVNGAGLSPWRRAKVLPLVKVACRAREGLVIGQGNHFAVYPGVEHPLTVTDALCVHHFPYRSAEQMIRKARNGAAAYAATDLPEEVGRHWRDYGRLSDEQLAEVFRTYFYSSDPEADGLVHDPV